jgi:hypothetical protein
MISDLDRASIGPSSLLDWGSMTVGEEADDIG